MKINSINNTYNSPKQNFNGLWGKTSRYPDFDIALGIPTIQDIYYYYPFADESQPSINKIIEDNSSAEIKNDTDDVTRYIIKDCKQCTTLPFKEIVYKNYRNIDENDRISRNMRIVHNSVNDKYLTNEYKSQVSAANDVVSKRMLDLSA